MPIFGGVIGRPPVAPGNVAVFADDTAQVIEDGGPPGGGDVVGPASSTDLGLVAFDGASGKVIRNAGVLRVLGTFGVNASVLVGQNDATGFDCAFNNPGIRRAGATRVLLDANAFRPANDPNIHMGGGGQAWATVRAQSGTAPLPGFHLTSGSGTDTGTGLRRDPATGDMLLQREQAEAARATATGLAAPDVACATFNGAPPPDVRGPAGAPDLQLVFFDGATGKAIRANGNTVPGGVTVEAGITNNGNLLSALGLRLTGIDSGSGAISEQATIVLATGNRLLPTDVAAFVGQTFFFRNIAGSPVTLTTQSGETIEGGASITVASGDGVIVVKTASDAWHVIVGEWS